MADQAKLISSSEALYHGMEILDLSDITLKEKRYEGLKLSVLVISPLNASNFEDERGNTECLVQKGDRLTGDDDRDQVALN